MKRWFIGVVVFLVLSASWLGVNFVAFFEGWGADMIAPKDDDAALVTALSDLVLEQHKGNAALAILQDGRLYDEYYVSVGTAVNGDSVFGIASLSKWITAAGVMVLVEDGKLDLDTPVEQYLSRWHLPPSQYDNNLVTLRRLLSHTAGIEDGLGHQGFAHPDDVQPLESHLTQAKDAGPNASGKVIVTAPPGQQWSYSGGSYNLIQLIVEEVSGMTFVDYMKQAVFTPLGMKNTGFVPNRPGQDWAQYFGENQELLPYPYYTSLAATGMYSSVNDLIQFAQSQLPSNVRKVPSLSILSDDALAQMRAPLGAVDGMDIWGAGVILFAPTDSGNYVVGHGGLNPFINASVRINPDTGNGFVMLQTGNEAAFASDMGSQWTLWETGRPDLYMVNNGIGAVAIRALIGEFILIVLTGLAIWRAGKQKGEKLNA